uniref:caspase-2-like n=1 Tax=Styela clava TaxID=7725 RepID=UPI00193A4811|nr:caspase-2-like [Styela clava]
MMKRGDIYTVTNKFSEEQWREFTRLKLDVDEDEIDELENRWGNNFQERKFKTVMKWQDRNPRQEDLMQQLITMKHEYFCGEHEEMNQTRNEQIRVVQPAADLDNLQARGYQRCLDFERYKVTTKKGLVLIISNSFTSFAEEHHRTLACHKDAELMEELWRDTVGCTLLEGRSHRDKSAADMRDLLRKLGRSQGYDYVVVVISTHGGTVQLTGKKEPDKASEKYKEVLLGNDGAAIQANEIQSFFDKTAAKNLQDIPKLFILQYCTGDEIDTGVYRQGDAAGDTMPVFDIMSPLMPKKSDVVTAYPAHEKHLAYRNESGSWFIQSIYNVFRECYQQKHVTDMLTKVNREMMNRRGVVDMNDCKSMSIYESSLTKDFYLVKSSIHGDMAEPVESNIEGKKRPRHH